CEVKSLWEIPSKWPTTKRPYSLTWNNGTPTTIPEKASPLPEFPEHLMELDCHNGSQVDCDTE
ncbi:hypothetical protein SK128_001151, partial [Halocaridina rubra]